MVAASAAVVSFLAAGCMATAAPSEAVPVDRERQQYSADGTAWGGVGSIPWDTTTIPVPGGPPNSTSFHLRVRGDTAVNGEVYLGKWSIDRGSAWFRVDVNGVQGKPRVLPGAQAPGPGVLMSEFSLPAGESVLLTLNVGVPSSEVEQSARITPDWGITLQERPASGGGSGSAGSSGSSGIGGSLGSGSIGSPGGNGSSGASGSSGSSGSSGGFGSLGSPSLGFG
ncbi:hypothetical protein K3888_14495 [Dietzia aurantiaca]|uniref:hypothetical protein n=1 Tax=Dietzia aurantiaca TaxID=983873 RepID=UPI001E63245A|nr:hypothetical protein [Dietzia aurantiaca]MCD2263908.1 hypothetical protein [Dietzia aurantiaca]